MAAYPGYAPYSPLSSQRSQQIEELLASFPGCKAINPDRSVFDLPLELKDKKATALRVSLPPHFPQERPVLSVLLPVIHPAVDGTGRVHTSQLNTWVFGQSKLVDVVAEAVRSLTDGVADTRQANAVGTVPYPPGYPGAVPAASTSYPPAPGPLLQHRPNLGSSTSPTRLPANGAATLNGPMTPLPDISQLSAAQMQQCLTDEAEFKKLLKLAVQKSPMAATLEDIRVKNRQLAESNLSKQNAINEVRNQLAVVKSSEYILIKQHFDELHARQKAVLDKLGTIVFKERLEDAVSESDASSNALSTAYLEGQVPLDQFLNEYVEHRTRHHVTDLKRQAADSLL
eukprot:jgi/Chrzof1/4699/Cz14g23090.t1